MNPLHQFCLDSLNTEITKALVCGRRLSFGQMKDLVITFGALHLFVVSGAHLHLWNKSLLFLKASIKIRRLALFFLICICDFSAPIMRAFTQLELSFQKKIHLPKDITPFFAFILCSPLAYLKNEFFSLSLSFVFAKIISINKKNHWSEQLYIATLALPIFLSALGVPHYSSVLIVPIFGALLIVLMPLSFLALFSNYIEFAVTKTWWSLEHVLSFIHVFYNSPLKPKADFNQQTVLIILFYGILINLFIYTLGVLWKRKSYFLYYS